MDAGMKTRIILAAAMAAGLIAAGAFALAPKHAAPDVRFAMLSGERLSTADLHGKVVLINFWATWCTTCVEEMPRVVDTYRKFAPRGFETIAVAVQSDHPNQVAAFAQRRGLPFKVALDTTGEVAKSFGNVRITPTSYLVGKDGRVIRKFVGEPDWAEFHALVEKALGS